ncbi:MAG: response regulator [Acidobacteriota bacterium]|nr:response regulator [Acidobacteriota bacterium]
MNVSLPTSFENSLDLVKYRQQLTVLSIPFFALAIISEIYAFAPASPFDAGESVASLIFLGAAVAMFALPRSVLSGNANVLIPVAAALSATFAAQASGDFGIGTAILVLAPVMWASLYLKPWKSVVVLVVIVVAQSSFALFDSNLGTTVNARRSLITTAFGLVIVFSIQELRHRLRRAHLESEDANDVMRRALDEVTRRDHVLTNISQGIDICDPRLPDSPTIFVSESFERLTGYPSDELLGRDVSLLYGPDTSRATIDELRRGAVAGDDCSVEILCYRKDGSTFWNARSVTTIRDDSGNVVNLVGVNTDVTKRHELEERLMQSQKMEVVGTLSAGMAHDFNNSLLVIRGYNALITKAAVDPTIHQLAQKVDDAVHQASEVTHRLLAYSRFHESHPSATNINTLLQDTITLWGRLLGDKIVCNLELGTDLALVMIDRGQLEQAIVNLITNCRDAMPHGGDLTIRSSQLDLRTETISPKAHLRPGSYVLVEVIDSGVGMDDETRARIFEPFYTTKTHGTGLGLPTVENVIRQSGGGLEVLSELGRGTTFRLYLPCSPLLTLGEVLEDLNDPQLGGDETVLVVEDLELARELLVTALSERGFHVLTAPNGLQALEVVAQHDGPIPLLVTDVDMPDLDGPDLARQLLATHPEMKIVFVSGYPVSDLVYDPDFAHRAAFVAKPYKVNELLREMRRILV